MDRPKLEIADIFRLYGEDYRKKHGSTMSSQQYQAMRDIEICRTAALGGHVEECDACGHQKISYNSCRNRHCPKCQALDKARWLEARRNELLPVEYYHVIFTLPDPLLAPIALQNKRVFYDLLFRAVSSTLLTIAKDPKHLGANIGFTTILHTWGQKLFHHPHIHCLVPGGGLSLDGQKWISCSPKFFLDVEELSKTFKENMVKQLQKAFEKGRLKFYGRIKHLTNSDAFHNLLDSCSQIDWVVFSKAPFGGPETVLDYLSRYTHQVAIGNHRILSIKNGKITFTYKDYANDGSQRNITLDAEEFIRRFLLHILPDKFTRIRYYGFLANCHRKKKLQLCRTLLGIPEVPLSEKKNWIELILALTGQDPLECPNCHHGCMVRIKALVSIPVCGKSSPREPP